MYGRAKNLHGDCLLGYTDMVCTVGHTFEPISTDNTVDANYL